MTPQPTFKPTPEELATILSDHKKWLDDDNSGTKADLRWADLRWADLSGADLTRADLPTGFSVLQLGPLGSRTDYLVVIISEKTLQITTGCFSGTLEEFQAAVTETHGESKYGRAYQAAIAMIQAWAELQE